MTCKGSVNVGFVLPRKTILVIHRSELNIIGRNAYISCFLASTVRHDTNHVQTLLPGRGRCSRWEMVMMRDGVTQRDGLIDSVTCQTGRLVDHGYIHNTYEILPHQSLTSNPRPYVMALPCTESLGALITGRNAKSDLLSYGVLLWNLWSLWSLAHRLLNVPAFCAQMGQLHPKWDP